MRAASSPCDRRRSDRSCLIRSPMGMVAPSSSRHAHSATSGGLMGLISAVLARRVMADMLTRGCRTGMTDTFPGRRPMARIADEEIERLRKEVDLAGLVGKAGVE